MANGWLPYGLSHSKYILRNAFFRAIGGSVLVAGVQAQFDTHFAMQKVHLQTELLVEGTLTFIKLKTQFLKRR